MRRLKNGGDDLRTVPAVISGDGSKRTSVVLAKSVPAKKLGVRTGEPINMALRKCPSLVVAAPDFRLYERSSAAFMDICRDFAPVVQQYSIDECFLDMTGTGHMYPDPVAAAHMLKDRIRDTLGFTVNVGVGPNRLLAKMAGDFEKPDKVHTLFADELEAKLWPLGVGELLFVGKSTAAKLNDMGIKTVGELAAMDAQTLQRRVGVKMGQQLYEYSHGIDASPVPAEQRQAKGYSMETTFETDVTDPEHIRRTLLSLCDRVCRRMRADGARANCVSVHVRGADFSDSSHQRRLWEPTDVTEEIFEQCARLLAELWDGRTPLRLIGAALSDVTRCDDEQLSLFTDEKRERQRKRDAVMDSIRSRYGADTITRASVKDIRRRPGLGQDKSVDYGEELKE